MESQAKKSIHPLMWVAAFMGWIPGSAGKPADRSLIGKLDGARALDQELRDHRSVLRDHRSLQRRLERPI